MGSLEILLRHVKSVLDFERIFDAPWCVFPNNSNQKKICLPLRRRHCGEIGTKLELGD